MSKNFVKTRGLGHTLSSSAVRLDLKALAEIRARAARCPLNTSNLTYLDCQSVLHIYGLVKYLETFGIQIPFELNVEFAQPALDNKDRLPYSTEAGFDDE
jgi:hypothetical protein